MSPQITISPATFGRLQKYAVPLIDDIDMVLNKVMDLAESKQGAPSPTGNVKDFSAGAAPNLTFTKLLSAEVGGKTLGKNETTWNHLLIEAVNQAAAKLNDVNALKRLIIANHVVGKKDTQGYRFIPAAGVSVQGQDAIGAWKATSHILKSLHIPAEVVFVWYDSEKAAHPGLTGKFMLNKS
ncbi:MAG: hypothetical protein KGK33_05070 [Hyphomicrobiales bacterium]|nr:hypothetical protein [Hyphomicrobiales bacterium]MDE2283969.1 hypothetical protein [Hyphomicrobiales bacterium]